MEIRTRRRLAWAGALLIAVSLLLSAAAVCADSFSSTDAGIRYRGTYRIGSTSTGWKKSLGKYTRKKYDGCTAGTNSYMYTFKSRGVKVETLQSKKGGAEQIITIILSKKTVPTIAGLRVGDKVSKMVSLYGTGYKKSGTTYKYTRGTYRMTVNTNAKTQKITKITLLKDI